MAYCERVDLGDGSYAWLRLSGRRPRSVPCYYCAEPHSKLCDFPLGPGRACDRKLCEDHAEIQDDGLDYCRAHREAGDLVQGSIL